MDHRVGRDRGPNWDRECAGNALQPLEAWERAQLDHTMASGVVIGKSSITPGNTWDTQCAVDAAVRVWGDRCGAIGWAQWTMTDLLTREGFADLCDATDAFSSRVTGWAILTRQTSELALRSVRGSIWRRKPGASVRVRLG